MPIVYSFDCCLIFVVPFRNNISIDGYPGSACVDNKGGNIIVNVLELFKLTFIRRFSLGSKRSCSESNVLRR